MTVEDFQKTFNKEIKEVASRAGQPYSVGESELAAALFSSAKKYLVGSAGSASGNSGLTPQDRQAVADYFVTLNCEDLCLAVACARGDETAWSDFYRDYRSYLINISRTMTQDAGAAEQLADSTFAELYGLRESGGVRISKFS